MPNKGKLSDAEKALERASAFAEARRKHSGVESATNTLEHCGLDRIQLHCRAGFELAIDQSVLAGMSTGSGSFCATASGIG